MRIPFIIIAVVVLLGCQRIVDEKTSVEPIRPNHTTSGSTLAPPPVTKPLWMFMPKSWHRNCKRWIKPVAMATLRYGEHRDHPLMYAAQVRQESLCEPSTKSHVGAMGLLQLMPTTAREIARKWGEGNFDPWDVGANIKAGIWYDQVTRRFWNPEYRSWCDRVMLMFSGYNSGNGYWLRAQKKCEKKTPGQCNSYYQMAEFMPQANPRGAKENLNYVRLISQSWFDMMGNQSCGKYDATHFLTRGDGG